MLKIANPSLDNFAAVRAYAKKHLGSKYSVLYELITKFSREDAIIAKASGRIVGMGAILRMDEYNVAIGCFKLSKSAEFEKAEDAITNALVSRAKQISTKFVSCIPGSDDVPRNITLERHGFLKQKYRSVFRGTISVAKDLDVANRKTSKASEAWALLKSLDGPVLLNLHYRPTVPTQSGLEFALANGSLIFSERGNKVAKAFVFESKSVVDEESRRYMIPDYLVRRGEVDELTRTGEITLLSDLQIKDSIEAACSWLLERDINYAYVYSSLSDESGFQIMQLGFDLYARQEIWLNTIAGPLDGFIGN